MATHLTEQQATEVLQLLKGSDALELKVTVADSDIRSAANVLGMDPLEAEIRQAVFFDTPDLKLSAAGMAVRARRIQGGGADTVVKLRPVDPAIITGTLRKNAAFKVEVDAMPGGFVCSASMKGKATAAEVRSVMLGESKISTLFSREQRDFYRAHAPEGLRLRDLAMLGPINIMKLIFLPKEMNRKFVAELWLYPDGTRILELSTKGTPATAFQLAAETRQFLTAKGIDLTAEQQAKTTSALKYFSALHGGPSAALPVEPQR